MTTDAKKYTGPYRGVVVSNVDPLKFGRLLVQVEDVLGDDPCIWATPVSPMGGLASGGYVVPQPRAGVWVVFENGDPDRAVWTGFWRGGVGEVPPAAQNVPPGTPQIILGTPTQNYLLITDAPGPTGGIQIQLHGPGGPYIKINESGIELSAGPGQATIRLAGPLVTINNGALTVQ